MFLQVGQLGVDLLDFFAVVEEEAALDVAEELQDRVRGWPSGCALLWVKRQVSQLLFLHREAHLPLQECLDEKSEEVDQEERLDPSLVLQKHGGNLVDGFRLLEALLQLGLALVRLENLLGCQRAVVRQEGVHAVGLHVVRDRIVIDLVGDARLLANLS